MAMIPMWVIAHPDVHGNGSRIAVYAGLQAVAYEGPDTNWRSTREMAVAVSEIVGIGEEACRKHLSALVLIGAIVKTPDEVRLPMDDPALGIPVGTTEPKSGSAGTQSGGPTSTSEKRTTKNTVVGTHDRSAVADREHFDELWKLYPRKIRRPAAERAWHSAITKAKVPPETILAGLRARCAWWAKAHTPVDKIPYPATWLNGAQWTDVIEPVPTADKPASAAQAEADLNARQRDDVETAIANGDDELAWRLLVEKARARQATQLFAAIAGDLRDGRTDDLIRGLRNVGQEAIDNVRAERERVRAAAHPDLSPPVPQLPR